MRVGYDIAIVIIAALVTVFTRVLPFVLFSHKKKDIPPVITYLGAVLPPAVMAALVVYSIKGISFSAPSLWMYEIIAVILTAVVHIYKRNTLISITVGTAIYMVLVQGQFF
jgi:branched-subunit amino acid transport protein AzlD